MPNTIQPNPGGETPPTPTTPDEKSEGTQDQALSWETWLSEQPDEVKSLLDSHTSGLKGALKSERETRSKLERDLRDLAKKAEKDSEEEKSLTGMADQIAAADRKADFFEAAHAAGVINLKLAYLVATSEDLFDRRGQVNFETLKASYPELFGGAKRAPGDR